MEVHFLGRFGCSFPDVRGCEGKEEKEEEDAASIRVFEAHQVMCAA